MKRTFKKIALASVMSLSLVTGSLMLAPAGALAAMNNGAMNPMNQQPGGMMNNAMVALADTAGEIVSGTTTNSAADLTADLENATTITVTDEDNEVTITESGTYVITGSASDGNITVKKGTTGVVLVLEDLDLTSTTGAALSVNKDSVVQIVVSGSVTLTDAENPADETDQDAEVADAYDGAALKIKAGSSVYLTGDGTLTVNGNAKNGIKAGDDASLVIDGEDLTIDIIAANDGINVNYDLTIANGTVTISAADDALHADRILTVGSEDESTSPTVTVTRSNEGMEGTVVNIYSGNVSVKSTDDAINAANSDDLYANELAYSINITGGTVTVSSQYDGLDSNGNVNLTGGTVTVLSSARNGGDAGIDYDGNLYVSSDATLNNNNGIAGPDQMPGQMNGQMGMPGQMGQMGQNTANGQQVTPPNFNNQNGQSAPDGQQMNQPSVDTTTSTIPNGQNSQSAPNSQQMNPPDFNNQNGQAMPNGQQMTPPDFNNQNGQGMPNDQQMTPPDFNSQNGQNVPNGQQMTQPDFNSQNGQAVPNNQQMAAPDFNNQNSQAVPAIPGCQQNEPMIPQMNQKVQPIDGQTPDMSDGQQPIMNQPMGMGQMVDSFRPAQQNIPLGMNGQGQRPEEINK